MQKRVFWVLLLLGTAASVFGIQGEYFGLERGVVYNLMFPKFGMTGEGFHEVTKYCLNDGVVQMEPATTINLFNWTKVPKDIQELDHGRYDRVGTLRLKI